eukprot:scaffold219782_cov13-Prasinocladus_malaysianus.AAC.1
MQCFVACILFVHRTMQQQSTKRYRYKGASIDYLGGTRALWYSLKTLLAPKTKTIDSTNDVI